MITGARPADEKLRQDHIVRAFDASHVPVREGLLRLEAPGLAQFVPSDMLLTYGMAPFVADDLVKVALAVLSVTKLPQGRAERFCTDVAWRQVRDVAGSGESRSHPESVPINALLPIKGMQLAQRSAGVRISAQPSRRCAFRRALIRCSMATCC